MKIVILAAGIGSRLGNPFPKPLTQLDNGKMIMQQQIENLVSTFSIDDIYIVVGFKKDMIMEHFPDVGYIYNENFDQTNTSKSLLKAIKKFQGEDILWLNGDVVFDEAILKTLLPSINDSNSFVCVNNSSVAEEEVKYTLDENGHIKEISKTVQHALGEAVGINFISKNDTKTFIKYLELCGANDYFERGLELAIQKEKLKISTIDISDFLCMEIDFREDLNKVNSLLK